MIERIKTVTWEVRSHGQETTISSKGKVLRANWEPIWQFERPRATIKKRIWHLEDVLKCMRQIEKEKQARKEKA